MAKPEPPTGAQQGPARQVSVKDGKRTGDAAKDVTGGNDPKKSKTGLKSTESLLLGEGHEKTEAPPKKHDHSGYVNLIKNKAIDQLNKHSDVSQARYCRDLTTDQWSLTLYFAKKRTYWFVRYAWDAIDEKWDQAFESGKLPIKRLKDHLRYSGQGKDCKILKGGRVW